MNPGEFTRISFAFNGFEDYNKPIPKSHPISSVSIGVYGLGKLEI
jgi:hypothetical protein